MIIRLSCLNHFSSSSLLLSVLLFGGARRYALDYRRLFFYSSASVILMMNVKGTSIRTLGFMVQMRIMHDVPHGVVAIIG